MLWSGSTETEDVLPPLTWVAGARPPLAGLRQPPQPQPPPVTARAQFPQPVRFSFSSAKTDYGSSQEQRAQLRTNNATVNEQHNPEQTTQP